MRAKNPRPNDKCSTHEHPEPTAEEQARMALAFSNAINAINEAYALANRTPSYHDLTDDLGAMIAQLTQTVRTL